MTEAVTTATSTLGVDLGRVLELDEDGERLTHGGRGRHARRLRRHVGHPAELSESEGAGHTLRTGEPTIVEDMATETRFTPSPTLLELGVVASLSVPIEGHDQPFGVLNVNAREPRDVLRGRGRVPHRDRDADHHRRRARPRGAGDPPRRPARSAHRPAEPHARARPARAGAGPPAARAHRRRGLRARHRRLQADQRLARARRRRRGAARAGAPADRRGAHDRHRRAPRRRRVRRHLPRRRRRARRHRRRRAARGRDHPPAEPRQRRALLHGQHRRHAGRDQATTPRSRCSATPTRRCTAPRRAAAAATSCSTRRCAPA